MQFFLLLVVNIFLGAVFYLIISLKLERSANEFRAKRLRREMEEIINEFNNTAERNISLLESRIATLRRLLELSGSMKSIDVTVGDEEDQPARSAEVGERPETNAPDDNDPIATNKKGLIGMMGKMINAFNSGRKDAGPERVTADDRVPRLGNAGETPDAVTEGISEDEITQVIAESDSRFSLITRLHQRGCPAEDISRYSGIPLGEVKLVLNLSDSR